LEDHEESSPSIAGEAKSLASSFVATVGLLDIILGGLALYSARLLYGVRIESQFPSTGFVFVDIALLACGAALFGKLIFLLVSGLIMGIVEWRWSSLANEKRLNDALATYRLTTKRNTPDSKVAPMDLAIAYLASDSPGREKSLEQIRTAAHFAYGAAVLCIPFFYYLRQTLGSHWLLETALTSVAFLNLGILQQFDYFENVIASLSAVKMKEQKEKKEIDKSDGD
jgi:hypothetical protein